MVKQKLDAAMMPPDTRSAMSRSWRTSTTNPASGGPPRAAVPRLNDNKPKARLSEGRPGGGGGGEDIRMVRRMKTYPGDE